MLFASATPDVCDEREQPIGNLLLHLQRQACKRRDAARPGIGGGGVHRFAERIGDVELAVRVMNERRQRAFSFTDYAASASRRCSSLSG